MIITDWLTPTIIGSIVWSHLIYNNFARENRLKLYESSIDFLKTRIKLDQSGFELGYHYFGPKIKVIAPWRIWKLNSRTDLIKYAKKNKIPIPKDKKGSAPFSVDDNLFHTSTEGKVLENPSSIPE